MEGMVKKYQQKFRKVRDETKRWDELQSRLLSQFRNASSIIERLQVSLSNPTSHFWIVIHCILLFLTEVWTLFSLGDSKFQKLRYFEMHRWDRRCSVKKADGVFGNHFALIEKDSVRIIFILLLLLLFGLEPLFGCWENGGKKRKL